MTMMLTKDGRNALSVEVLRQVPLECMSNTQLAQWNLLVKKGEPPKDKDPDAVRNALAWFNANPGVHRATSLGWKAVNRIARENARKEREEEDVGGERQQTATTKDRRPPVCAKEDVKMTAMTMGGLPSSYACSKLSEYQLAAQMGMGVGAYRKMLAKEKLRKQQAEAKLRAAKEGQASPRPVVSIAERREAKAAQTTPVSDMAKRMAAWSTKQAQAPEPKPEPEPEVMGDFQEVLDEPTPEEAEKAAEAEAEAEAEPEVDTRPPPKPGSYDFADLQAKWMDAQGQREEERYVSQARQVSPGGNHDLPSIVLHQVEAAIEADGVDRRRLRALADLIEELPLWKPNGTRLVNLKRVESGTPVTHYTTSLGGPQGFGMLHFAEGATNVIDQYVLTGYGMVCWGWGLKSGMQSVVDDQAKAAELQRVLSARPVYEREVRFDLKLRTAHVASALRKWLDGASPVEAYRQVRDDILSQPGVIRTAPKPEPKPVVPAKVVPSAQVKLDEARAKLEAAKRAVDYWAAKVEDLEGQAQVEAEQAQEQARKDRLIELLGSGMGIEEALKAL